MIVCYLLLTLILKVNCSCNKSDIFYKDEVINTCFGATESKSGEFEESQNFVVYIREGNISLQLNPFWKSTGLCPPDPHQDAYKFLLSSDMEQNFFHIGSLPKSGIRQVRIHWLLDLIKIRISPKYKVFYNFEHLDKLIHILWKNGLQPGFELMGNPSNYFTDFENSTQIYLWRNLVQMIAAHYIDLFGIEYVMEWNFETWNEPDHHDFDNLNFTTQGFLNYYDACSEGLKAIDDRLRFGGPGGSCRIPSKGHSPLCWALLSHCSRGKNYFTGEIGVRLDFISFHKKGNGSTFLIFDEEIETMVYIRKNYPRLFHVPFYNDEGDPLKNWSLPQYWRADTTYAAMVVKIILNHILLFIQNEYEIFKDLHFQLLSSDNAFLSYFPNQFTQRTLLSRFQVNNTRPNYVEFVKKPVYTAFALLSRLCPHILVTKIYSQGTWLEDMNSDFGVLSTECEQDINIILYNTDDTQVKSSTALANIYINVSQSYVSDPRWAVYKLDNVITNPYLVWQNLGMPTYPTLKEFSLMKNCEEPHMDGPYELKNYSPWKFQLEILNPGVTLINICKRSKYIYKVQNIRFLQTWNFTLQVSWSDDYNRCISTYNIEQSFTRYGPFYQLNKKNITLPSYWHSCFTDDFNCTIKGFYRVNAIDYWGNQGPYSTPFEF